ncbi:unnamed protein product [Heligmosomoides polygyrus]|uniref:FERM domain-containing protein n=1 Tax=Heligmosomoides polygyrus TaxID=6339 RepID=A0A183FW60_HELPZ|nr:unnamed protein product [Heligmosomoides polygyrus]
MAFDFRAQGLPQHAAEAVAYNQIKEIAVRFGVNITDFIPQLDCEPVAFGGEFVDIAQLREEGQYMYLALNLDRTK